MRKKSKSRSGKKKNTKPRSKNCPTSVTIDPLSQPPPVETSSSLVPIENQVSNMPSDVASSSNLLSHISSEELFEISQRMKLIVDKTFQNNSEMVVNRRILEDLVSQTLEDFCNQDEKYKHCIEVNHLIETCKALQAEEIRLNRLRYSLTKHVEDAKFIIKKMINEKELHSSGVVRKTRPGGRKRIVRSVGLQVCIVGHMYITKPVIPYATAITSQYTRSMLSPEKPCTSGKQEVEKKVNAAAKKNVSTTKVNQSRTSKANGRVTIKKEPCEPKLNVTTRRMSTRRTKVEEVEYVTPKPPVKTKPVKEVSKAVKNVKQKSKPTKEEMDYVLRNIKQEYVPTNTENSNLRKFNNGNTLGKANNGLYKEVIIKEELIFDEEEVDVEIIEISSDDDDDEVEVVPTQKKGNVMINIKKEVGTQANEKIENNEKIIPDPSEVSSGKSVGPLIKVRSPEFINEQFIKSLNSSTTTENKQVSFCKFPKYPMTPKYPPGVTKPPAPILQVGKQDGTGPLGITLTWSFACKKPENIVEYQLFAYQERHDGKTSNDVWKKVGDIQALPLPMACYLSQFVAGETYHFIVRAVDNQKRLGDFSIPAGIKLQTLDPSKNTTSATIFKFPPPQNAS